MIPFVGNDGETFSIFTHYVSELGELGVSEFAVMFNLGMMLAGLVFVPFMIGLGKYLNNFFAKLAGIVGVYTSLSIFFVGVFPMNFIVEHTIAALSFFLSGMVMVGLWTLALLVQREVKIPKILSLGGVVNFVIFASFLFGTSGEDWSLGRPEFSMQTTLEWGIYFAIIGYLLILSVYVWNKNRISAQNAPE